MCLRRSIRAGKLAFRFSSSAPDRIGATGPIFRRHDRELSTAEVLESFIGQFYDERPAPALMLLSEDVPNWQLLAEAFSLRAERKVEISVPQRGEKREIVEMALHECTRAVGRRHGGERAQRELLEGVAEVFGLETPPKRIEVYDNSHIQGAHALGAMIVAGPDGFEKGEYRKFNIKSTDLTPGDDYGMMREVLTRRFARLVKESEDARRQMARPGADRRRAGAACRWPGRSSRIWASRTWCWWASPRGRTAMRGASIST